MEEKLLVKFRPAVGGVRFLARAQWQIIGQNVENFKPLNFRTDTFYNKVYEMKYLQHILIFVIKDKPKKNMKVKSVQDDSFTKQFLIIFQATFV